jgi:hypothetical protein
MLPVDSPPKAIGAVYKQRGKEYEKVNSKKPLKTEHKPATRNLSVFPYCISGVGGKPKKGKVSKFSTCFQ